MKIKGLTQSKGERVVKTILEDRLTNTPFQVGKEIRLSAVIGREPREKRLPDELFNYLTRAGLDFLIFYRDPPNLPFLAVEFDGAHHETDPEARKRDLLKNRLCQMVEPFGLPLLRVRYQEIEPLFTRDSFLSYLVEIVLRYKMVDEKKGYDPYAEIRRHDLADLQRLRNQISKKHHIIPLDQAAQILNATFAYEFSLGRMDAASSETDTTREGHLDLYRVNRSLTREKWPVIHQISKEITLRTHYRTIAEPRPPDSSDLGAYVKWLEKKPLYHPDLPGVRWLYVAWNILEGLCLKQLLSDAEGRKLQV